MGNEYPLKTMVIGLENLAKDNEALCRFMVLRAQHYGWKGEIRSRPNTNPLLPNIRVSRSRRRGLRIWSAEKIADNNARAVISMKKRAVRSGATGS